MYERIDDDGRRIKLRKGRRCEWCGQWIAKGEQAVHRVYLIDGKYRVHVSIRNVTTR